MVGSVAVGGAGLREERQSHNSLHLSGVSHSSGSDGHHSQEPITGGMAGGGGGREGGGGGGGEKLVSTPHQHHHIHSSSVAASAPSSSLSSAPVSVVSSANPRGACALSTPLVPPSSRHTMAVGHSRNHTTAD